MHEAAGLLARGNDMLQFDLDDDELTEFVKEAAQGWREPDGSTLVVDPMSLKLGVCVGIIAQRRQR